MIALSLSLLDHGLTIEDITSDPNTTLFDWPQDLPKPTIILYMTVSTDTRLKRRIQAGASPERSSQRASVRDANLQTIHSLIRESKVVAIDANGTANRCSQHRLSSPRGLQDEATASFRQPQGCLLGSMVLWPTFCPPRPPKRKVPLSTLCDLYRMSICATHHIVSALLLLSCLCLA